MDMTFAKRLMFSALLAALVLLPVFGPASLARAEGQTEVARTRDQAESATESKIRAVLDGQVAAWNRGDLVGYMAGYWKSPDLSFYSSGTVTTGWQPTLFRYRQRYQGEGREMGQLTFGEVQILPLSENAAVVRGHWSLRMSRLGKEPRGLFTVVMKRLPEGWRIVHDHSSGE